VIRLCVYLAPVPGGMALVAPPEVVEQVRAVGYLLQRKPQAVRVAVLTPAEVGEEVWREHIGDFIRRLTVVAGLPVATSERRLSGRWVAVLATWGVLLLLAAGGNLMQVVGGLWLALFFPWLRRVYHGSLERWARRPLTGLALMVEAPAVELLVHPGLTRLQGLLETNDVSDAEANSRVADACTSLGLIWLEPVYRALSSRVLPPGVWAPIAWQSASRSSTGISNLASEAAPAAASEAATFGSTDPDVAGAPPVQADSGREGVEQRTSSAAI
jgi:hypothetical protein